MKNLGLHHVSSLVADVHVSYSFYHTTLGLKLLMKTVNQDDTSMYHLFFSDMAGQPGTEFTLFQLNSFKENQFGTNAISRTVFSVTSIEALHFWEERFKTLGIESYQVETTAGRQQLYFEDPDGLQLGIAVVERTEQGFFPRATSEIPEAFAIIGLHSVHLRVRYPKATLNFLTDHFGFELAGSYSAGKFPVTVLQNDNSHFHHEIHLIEDKINPLEDQGSGGVHHVALYVASYADLLVVQELLDDKNMLNSGIVAREFFYSTYFRDPNGILFEVATKTEDISLALETDQLDEVPLYLPTFLESQREKIEAGLHK